MNKDGREESPELDDLLGNTLEANKVIFFTQKEQMNKHSIIKPQDASFQGKWLDDYGNGEKTIFDLFVGDLCFCISARIVLVTGKFVTGENNSICLLRSLWTGSYS